MKRLLFLLSLVTASLQACAIPVRVVSQPVVPRKVGDAPGGSSPLMYWVNVNNAAIVTAGGSATTTIFDTTAGGTQPGKYLFLHRIMVAGYCNQTMTVKYLVQQTGLPGTWITAAGSNASFSMTGSSASPPVQSEVDYLVQGQESEITITSTTAPANCNIGIALFYNRILGQ